MPATPSTIPNRSCRYCKAKFKPVREDQRFCKPDHRKAFWKYGGLPFDKMRDQLLKTLRKELREIVREEIAAHNARRDDFSTASTLRQAFTTR